MKKTFICASLLLGAFAVVSCSNDSPGAEAEGTKVMIDLSTDLSFSGTRSADTRAINESAYKDITKYNVTLTKTVGNQTVHSAVYSEWNLAYQVEPGTQYTLSASYGEDAPASYDKLLVSGGETFVPQAGATKVVSFQCKPKAAKVNVVFDSTFDKYYSDATVSIKTKHMTDAVTMSKANVGQDLYLKADADGEDVALEFTIKDKSGKPITVEGMTNQKTVKVRPQTLLKLTFKPNVTEIEGGKFGVTINVDTNLKDEDVNIVLPNTVFE